MGSRGEGKDWNNEQDNDGAAMSQVHLQELTPPRIH